MAAGVKLEPLPETDAAPQQRFPLLLSVLRRSRT